MMSLLYTLAGLYLLVLLGMFVFQRNIMYLPEKMSGQPADYGLSGFSESFIASADGTRLQIWQREAAAGRPTVIYFHGNAYNLANRAGIFHALAQQGFGVLALSYRGYGKSDGSPHEQGIYHDARAIIDYALKEKRLAAGQIILFGESLGSGVAVQMANEYKLALTALQSPYISVATRAAEIYTFLPVQWLIQDRFDSIDKIASIKSPLIIFHGERDRTIPVTHGRALFDKATTPKQAHYFPEVDHNDFDPTAVSERLLAFYTSLSER